MVTAIRLYTFRTESQWRGIVAVQQRRSLSVNQELLSVGATDGNGDGANSPMTSHFRQCNKLFQAPLGVYRRATTSITYLVLVFPKYLSYWFCAIVGRHPRREWSNFEQVGLSTSPISVVPNLGGVTSIVFK